MTIGPNGQVNEPERDKMLLSAYNNTPEFYITLVEDFRDPLGANRLPVVLQIDATYIDMCSSIDPGKPKKFHFKPELVVRNARCARSSCTLKIISHFLLRGTLALSSEQQYAM